MSRLLSCVQIGVLALGLCSGCTRKSKDVPAVGSSLPSSSLELKEVEMSIDADFIAKHDARAILDRESRAP